MDKEEGEVVDKSEDIKLGFFTDPGKPVTFLLTSAIEKLALEPSIIKALKNYSNASLSCPRIKVKKLVQRYYQRGFEIVYGTSAILVN